MTREVVAINSRRASGSAGLPDYINLVSASGWIQEHVPATAANLWDDLHSDEARRPNPAWTPDHDSTRKRPAMSLTINAPAMTSSQSAHAARQTPSGHDWEVSWLPGRIQDRNSGGRIMEPPGPPAAMGRR